MHRQVENFMEQIQTCGERLRSWNRTKFGHVQTKLWGAQSKLEILQHSDPSDQQHTNLNEARKEVNVVGEG